MPDEDLKQRAAEGAGCLAVREPGDEGERLRLFGRITLARLADVEEMLAREASRPGRLYIDLDAVERLDTVGAMSINRLIANRPDTHLGRARPGMADLLAEVAEADRPCAMRPEPEPFLLRELERFGRYMADFGATLVAGFGFLGAVIAAAARMIRGRRRLSMRAVSVQMEQVGVSALGIVGLMSFLIGIVLAQQGAVQLRQFGAEVFTINLIGRATFRELGILLTAIMVAGRSASAFAAQIGSMKLAEEVDAMRTIGIDPMAVLVMPRVVALVFMMPLLAFYASVIAVFGGGLYTWLDLGIPPAAFIQRLQEVVPLSDFWIGLSKAPVFGFIIAVIGCFQGFQVSGNAESVGTRTTLAVVQAIFMVIVLDAFFAVFYTALGFI